VFEMFKQAGSATKRGEGGLGIGLAIVKNLSELHGGRVQVESGGEGKGATFRVYLPLHQSSDFAPLEPGVTAADRAGSRPARAAGRRHRRRARDLRLSARARRLPGELRLEREGSARADGPAEFDLLISDVGMPHMDGYELVTELRNRARTAGLPAIALTGHGRIRT
jgi:two-component system CheB/CheR fusion protein